MQSVPRFLLFAAVTGATAFGAFILAFFGGREISRAVPTSPLLALLLLAATPLLARFGRWAIGARGPVAAAIAIASLSLMIALGVAHELAEPLIDAEPQWCGTPRVMMEMSVPPFMFAAGAIAGLVASVLVAFAGARLDRFVRLFVTALGTLAALLVVASIVRAARHPDPDNYTRSLPIVAQVRVTEPRSEIQRRTAVTADGEREQIHEYVDELDGAVLRRVCVDKRCKVDVIPRGTTSEVEAPLTRWDTEGDTLIEVRRDPAHAVWAVRLVGDGTRPFIGPELRRRDVRARDVASSLSPPIGWILGALGGLAVAGALVALRRRASRDRAAIAAGRPGTLEPSGLVTVDGDDHPLRAAPNQPLTVGPVVVLPGPVAPGGLYRGDGLLLGARVACGTRDALLDAADRKIAHLDALALASLALTAAPLIVAAMVGIVI